MAVTVVHTHDQDTGRPVVWYRAVDGVNWSRHENARPGDGLFTWRELLDLGPVTEGHQVPEYRRGFYRLRGRLDLGGADRTVEAGTLLLVSEVVRAPLTPMAVIDTVGIPRVTVTWTELDLAGAERVDNP
jgi:hypothetical protein